MQITYRWDDLQLLLVLCRRGSLKAAAAELAVNISTVARRLDAFEASIEQHLFDRTPDGTFPTAAAEQLLPFAESMEQAAMGASNAIDGFEGEPEGNVRITAPPGLVDHFLAASVSELLSRHPKLTVEIISTIGYADLTRREADIALRSVRPAAGDLVATNLLSSASTAIVSCAQAAALDHVSNLDDVSWVTYCDDLGHLPDTSWITSQVSPANIALRTNSLTAQLQAVRSGLGATVIPRPFVELEGVAELRFADKLARMLKPFPVSSLWLVGHRALRDVPRIAATWTFLQERFRLDDVNAATS